METDRGLAVLSVRCALKVTHTGVEPCKVANQPQPIEMLFGIQTRVSQRKRIRLECTLAPHGEIDKSIRAMRVAAP